MNFSNSMATRARLAVAVGLVPTLGAGMATAQNYPNRPLRVIVPYSVGGATDISARIIAPRMSEAMGQQVVVDNRPGGAAIIGFDLVAKSPPDGYTLLLANIAFGANTALFKKLPFNVETDFDPVTFVAVVPTVLVVHPSLPVRSLKEFVALAKARPGQINYGSAGMASANHLTTEVFKSMTGLNLIHVPYKGGGPAVADLVGGQINVMFATIPSSLQHVRNKRLIPLGVSSKKRSAAMPEMATIDELGVKGFDVNEWQGIFVPARTPPAAIERLHKEATGALGHPDTRERMIGLGADVIASTPQELAVHLRAELARWAKVSKEANIKVD